MNFLRRNHKLSIVKASKAMNAFVKYNRINFNPMMHRKLHNAVDSIRKPISDSIPQIQVVDLLERSNVLPSSHTTYVAVDPFPNDVICARGRTYWDHPGNEMYRNLISLAVRQYGNAPNRQICHSLFLKSFYTSRSLVDDSSRKQARGDNRNGSNAKSMLYEKRLRKVCVTVCHSNTVRPQLERDNGKPRLKSSTLVICIESYIPTLTFHRKSTN